MIDHEFEWDDAKAQTNLRKHKISFRQARRMFEDLFALVEQDLTNDYGEDRFLATGIVDGLVLTVVFAERGTRIRIISARRANNEERKKYYRSQTPS
jgi:uncharacterized DUF497 family protein